MSFARKSDVRPNRISQILAGKRAVTGDSALRFGRWFDMDPQFSAKHPERSAAMMVAERLVGAKVRVLPTATGSE